jgi:prepilin-type processing-associated H-X9-DG protein
MRDGYGLVSRGVSALCNAVRSPTDSSRGYDLLMPSLAELSNGAKASVTITRVQGDDVIVSSQMDRSLLVNAAGCIGALGGSTGTIALVALASGIMMPALGKARESAKQAKSMAHMQQIGMGVMTYAAEFNDQLPASAAILVENGYLTDDIFQSPVGPVGDGHGDYFLNVSVRKMADVKYPNRMILGYDRAMLAERGTTVVLFYDGHVSAMEWDELMEHAAQPECAEIDFKFPE